MNDLLATEIADLRRQVKDLQGLETPPTRIGARVYNSANISVANNTTTTLTFDSERWDTDSIHSTSSNTGRLTAATAGFYAIGASVEYAFNATGIRQLDLRVNGTTVIDSRVVNSAAATVVRMGILTYYDLAVGDYVELRAFQNSGGNLNVDAGANYSPEFWMVRIA